MVTDKYYPLKKGGVEVEKKSFGGSVRMRMGILYEITALLIVVLLGSGLANFFLLRRSQNQLIDKSIDKLVETEARDFTSSFNYVIRQLADKYEKQVTEEIRLEVLQSFQEKRVTEFQLAMNREAADIVNNGFLNIDSIILLVPPSMLMPEATVFASSDPSLVFTWEAPAYVVQAVQDGTPYILRRNGVPELGLEGEQLLIISNIEQTLEIAGTQRSISFAYIAVRPMGAEIATIESYYSSEKNTSTTLLAVVLGVTLLAVVLIVFLVLSYLIRKRITQPVEELSAAAERVSQGDLDVEITVHAGSDFEILERTFRDMVESFRRYIAASVGEKGPE